MHEIRLKLIKKVSFSRISCIFRDFPRDGESDVWEDCRCKMSQKNGEHHHVYRQKDNVAYSFHIALILYIVIRLQIYKKICKPDNGKTENYTFPTLFPWFITLFQHHLPIFLTLFQHFFLDLLHFSNTICPYSLHFSNTFSLISLSFICIIGIKSNDAKMMGCEVVGLFFFHGNNSFRCALIRWV